jgi:KUP system potassium uptake protein
VQSSRPAAPDRLTLSPPLRRHRLNDRSPIDPHPIRSAREKHGSALSALALGALGVVYGDIGTSPLYALKESFHGAHGVPLTPDNVLGILSLVVWAMTFVVTFKYLSFVMRADNRGEGGILALMALVGQSERTGRGRSSLLVLGLFGAALLYGDGIITPAISVLGAVEGVQVATPALQRAVVPIAVAILVGLFAIQRQGTARVGAIFGPVMLTWFACIALLGIRGVLLDPSILRAVSPHHAAGFLARSGVHGFLVLGGVVLVVTGGEALYADMGHFGRRPIRLAWYGVAMPALLLNYLGQGALLLRDPSAVQNPFYLLVPGWALYPMIGIATLAAIVASQALISGAFSLTRQAVLLGYSPRVTIRHTSRESIGQIYVPEVNALLGVACVALVIGFRSSDALASAYGIAVTGTMSITTLLFHRVMRDRWHWSRLRAWPLTLAFLAVDLAFLSSNLVKLGDGGWFPVAVALAVYALLSTWKRGRDALGEQILAASLPLELLLADLERRPLARVPGTAVFLSSAQGRAPPVLLHHLKHNKVLHERVILVSIVTEEVPRVSRRERATVRSLGGGFHQVVARYGFLQSPDVPHLLQSLPEGAIPGPSFERSQLETTYYLGRETILPTGPARLARWRKKLFIAMARNAQQASAFFRLPPNRVVEMGAQLQL